LSNNKLLAMGDDNSMWWDATTGQVSYYNYPNGTLEGTSATTFTGGPYAGLTIASKLSSMIGYENNNVYFLDGSGTLTVYNTSMGFVRTDTVTLSGLLTGNTLGDLVDGKVPGYSYLGWDVGPIVLAASIPEPNGPALLLLTFLLGVLGIRRRSGKK
ncbi:MAG: sorting protein, partial [Verrucomicrobiales bacterium]|nr:sorting protein [Verrucomicrobiales bacterium]